MQTPQSTAQEQTYEQIKKLIVTGVFSPGARLGEREISKIVGVSRTPVREAMHRLATEGVIRSERNRGMFVEEVSFSQILDAFDIGASLESRCARLAAKRRTEDNIMAMGENVKKMNALENQSDEIVRSQFMDLDIEFHSLVREAANNRRLCSLTERAIGIPVLLSAYNIYTRDSFNRSARQHTEVYEAIKTGDQEWADVAMRNHILAGRNALSQTKNDKP